MQRRALSSLVALCSQKHHHHYNSGCLHATTTAIHNAASGLCTPRRAFFSGLFSSLRGGQQGAKKTPAETAAESAEKQNERLVDACLEILELCTKPTADANATSQKTNNNNNNTNNNKVVFLHQRLDDNSKDVLFHVADVMLNQGNSDTQNHATRLVDPWTQFDAVYDALALPVVAEQRALQRHLLVVLESIVPEPFYRLLEAHPMLFLPPPAAVDGATDGPQPRDVVLHLSHALLGRVDVPPELCEEEVILLYVDDFEKAFPRVAQSSTWTALCQFDLHGIATTNTSNTSANGMVRLALQSKLFHLLAELCAAFDTEHTGTVRLEELQQTAVQVLGEEKGARLLEGVQADKEGKIRYTQLISVLTRPPPSAQTAEVGAK